MKTLSFCLVGSLVITTLIVELADPSVHFPLCMVAGGSLAALVIKLKHRGIL